MTCSLHCVFFRIFRKQNVQSKSRHIDCNARFHVHPLLSNPEWNLVYFGRAGPPGRRWTQQFLRLSPAFPRHGGSCGTLILANWIGAPPHLFLFSDCATVCVFRRPGACQRRHFGDQAGGRVDWHCGRHVPAGRAPRRAGSAGQVWPHACFPPRRHFVLWLKGLQWLAASLTSERLILLKTHVCILVLPVFELIS